MRDGGERTSMDDVTEQTEVRRQKLARLKESGSPLYPNDFKPSHVSSQLHSEFGVLPDDRLSQLGTNFSLAGRIMSVRRFGKAAFFHCQDRQGRIQVYVRRDRVGEEGYELFQSLDVGDIVGAWGRLFRTRTKELTLEAEGLKLLSKCLRPLPEKWHGLADVEMRYRRRYVDLMVNREVKELFEKRSRIIRIIRRFFEERDFLEVETITHHNALDLELYLRVAPELFLKRLLVGGVERVFELNRNFRNEGISVRHNPEFTMLEFYQAYATYEDLISLTEELFSTVAREVSGSLTLTYGGQTIDLKPPWRRTTLLDALVEHGGARREEIESLAGLQAFARSRGLAPDPGLPYGSLLVDVFEEVAEARLVQPTFVVGYPLEVSPLARKKDGDPSLVDRFELYIAGRELANAFSELNDPLDQRERLLRQAEARRAGDETAAPMDEDFVRALEYGMPPAAGEGIGIDRMVMLFTDSASIRDVILFPLLRLER
jgi:lysyl-tRNA synthetase, class II